MKKRLGGMLLSVMLCVQLILPSAKVQAAQTIYDNEIGTQDGYSYELWKDYGETSMTLNGGGTFSCQWSNIGNALFRKGINFAYNNHNFTLRGCSNNANMAKIDLLIGGDYKGTFYFGDEYPAEYTISNVYHKTGSQTVELKVTDDNGLWDAYVDYLIIS